jgi:hypothetical protein
MANAKVANVVIANGQTLSRWVDNEHEGLFSDGITIYTPTGTAGTFTIEVTHQRGTPTIVHTLVIGGTDAAPPAAGKASVIPELQQVMQWRIKASVGVTGDQTFYVTTRIDD